ncbi:MAG: imidazole glycerol phosphate synthase subunit HisH [Candidatus Pelagibacter bacterium]|jgi:glutamine amidotransferase|nr:imidazole glycerol phosphate synthase subunit HisH [Candidatus Pelagibacter sp.]MDP7541106.1 imidazole glycerol phosphate synthase subunit HisH [Candidatus Pelagibacter bacterium]|tara:strand:- start:2057 stop:2689 length:633 start_codon:yes stop_codon:yes gene_type:complete
MNIIIVDYNSGNISSIINSFKTASEKSNNINIKVTSDLKVIANSDKVVLPGQGSFKSCVDSLLKIEGLKITLDEIVLKQKKPLLGICVGMQMFADIGYEESETKGFGWISGKVIKIDNQNGKFKLPHIGWNEISIKKINKIFDGINDKTHMYFVHSYEFVPNNNKFISSTTEYSKTIISSVEKDNIFGTQFHPEKSDQIGLKLIENFINL